MARRTGDEGGGLGGTARGCLGIRGRSYAQLVQRVQRGFQ
jgi:hypothetical protein